MADTTTTQIVREAPDIEAAKVRLLQEADRLYGQGLTLPAIEAAGLSATEQQAIDLAKQGQGVYAPYLQQGSQGVTRGMGLADAGAQGIAGLNIAGQFLPAQASMAAGMATTGQMGQYAGAAGEGLGAIRTGTETVGQAAGMMPAYMQADLGRSLGTLGQAEAIAAGAGPSDFTRSQGILGGAQGTAAAATQAAYQGIQQPGFQQGVGTAMDAARLAQMAAAQPGFAAGQAAVQQGIGALGGAAQGFDPTQTQAFMNPYQQQVIDEAMRQIERQGDVARQRAAAQAVGAGAFGSTREGVQRAELERALAEQKNAAIVGALSQGYTQAQSAAQQAFEQQQQRQLAQAQGYGGLGAQAAGISTQQAGAGQAAAQQLAQAGQLQASTAGQQAQLSLAAAQQQFQQAGFDSQTAMQLAQLQQTQQQQALQQSAALQGIGGLYGQQALQQAQLGQAGVAALGQLGAQQAQLGMLPAEIAKVQAGITGQQAGLYGTLGQGLGSLASSQAGLELQRGTNLANIGSQIGQMGVQQAALGEAAQRMNLADVNALTQLGGLERQNYQTQLDAVRATALQQEMAPYQQLAFVSDIYKGAPSSQMAMTSQSAPSASPFQQTVGTIAGTGAAIAGASKLF